MEESGGGGIFGIIILLFGLALVIATIAGLWKCFEKAGEPGWTAIIPIYNIYVLLKIVGAPIWFLILFFIPIVSIIAGIYVYYLFAKSFGKGAVYAIGILFVPFVILPLMGFGDDQYEGPTYGT
ncbi:DUF5684 domain-containing protein [Sulfidibacter corallicola]|uniref:Signal peptidase I n=1 Tax=Sulfidibacter corallicola TaxID=2818388 RepID=A0A8A4TP44_SULCO|nr:DUF5684 domain-containing protein [Sulfidibacter corallicola]QTD51320.1 hypothetical protein J3U87_02530 [Sulfidibacter corallicola]